MLPPIGPVGLDYVAASLWRHGYEPILCDLTFEDDWEKPLAHAIDSTAPLAIGVSIRNIDDAYFASQDFILDTTTTIIRHIRTVTDRPVVLGGVGFSVAPCAILDYTGAHYGIAGEGEHPFPLLLECIEAGRDVSSVPGVVFRTPQKGVVAVPPIPWELDDFPGSSRRFSDNRRYFAEGGQAGIETKRGCSAACIYCVEPKAKGPTICLRSPESVADEFADLLDQGVDVVHLCDSEFNLPRGHAHAVCDALVRRGISRRIHWYTYACPHPFDGELARAMVCAGCASINFGVDHGDDEMLLRLGRNYDAGDIRRAVQACKDAGLTVMCDMLLGAPGETRESIARAIDFMREINPDCVGLSCGVRVYPNTPLARMLSTQGTLDSNPNLQGTVTDNVDFLRPVFYVDAGISENIHAFVSKLVDGDKRFFHADPAQLEGNYNYNDNSVLMQAIRAGARGAYWDILRRM